MKASLLLALIPVLTCAQTKQPDMCAPPPSGAAPALPAKLMTGQGDVHFPITTSSPEAQKFFDQGVAQMHSFWAVEAERSFRQAAELDPAAPMPWWGVAMVAAGDYRPRFQLDTAKKLFGNSASSPLRADRRAIEAAERAKALAEAEGKATPVEKLYIDSVVARRKPVKDADAEYIQGLRTIVARYPKEVEAKSYLALHLMGGFTLPDHKPREGSMEAVALLKELLAEAPNHPGVHHYVIHGYEGSTFARDAWPSCRRYPELVTNIPHALHMPGHIWSQTGKWDEGIKSFSDAAVNERGYIKADKLYATGHHGHNVHYLATSYSFRGDYDKAKEAAQELLGFPENPREKSNIDGFYSAHRQGWFAMLRTLVQGERWDEILDGKTLPVYERPREQAWRHWALAQAYAAKGDQNKARAEARLMEDEMKQLKAQTKMPLPEVFEVAKVELEGQLLLAKGKTQAGLNRLRTAAESELKLVYSEPPYYPRPVLEVLGEAALKSGKKQEAESAFRRALEQYPESYRAQTGLRAATGTSGNTVAARR